MADVVAGFLGLNAGSGIESVGRRYASAQGLGGGLPIEVFTKGNDAGAGEDAEDVTLMVGEFCRRRISSECDGMARGKERDTGGCFSTELGELISKESVDAGQAEVSETGTVAQQRVDALEGSDGQSTPIGSDGDGACALTWTVRCTQ